MPGPESTALCKIKKEIKLAMNYLLERHRVLSNIKLTVETINNRLMTCFQGLEDEADTMCDEIQFENEEQYIDDNWHTRERHLKINYAMKQELLNNACVWIFHLFEKECKTIFKTDIEEEKKNHLKKLAISTDKGSSWWKINRELRLVANTIKHGEGKACDDLKKIRPEIFNTTPLFFSSSLVKISSMEFNKYSEIMFDFWSDYFKK